MSSRNFMDRYGFTRGKLITIAVLLTLLVAVIAVQTKSRPAARTEPETRPEADQSPIEVGNETRASVEDWPSPPLESTLSCDPFSRTTWFSTKPINARYAHVEVDSSIRKTLRPSVELSNLHIGFVMITGDHRVVSVGEEIFGVGEQIGEFEVVSIDTDQIRLRQRLQKASMDASLE